MKYIICLLMVFTMFTTAYAEMTQDQKLFFYSIVIQETGDNRNDPIKLMSLCDKTEEEKLLYIRAFKQKQLDNLKENIIRSEQYKIQLENDLK